MPTPLREELRWFRVKLGGVFGGLLFPSETDSKVPLLPSADVAVAGGWSDIGTLLR